MKSLPSRRIWLMRDRFIAALSRNARAAALVEEDRLVEIEYELGGLARGHAGIRSQPCDDLLAPEPGHRESIRACRFHYFDQAFAFRQMPRVFIRTVGVGQRFRPYAEDDLPPHVARQPVRALRHWYAQGASLFPRN